MFNWWQLKGRGPLFNGMTTTDIKVSAMDFLFLFTSTPAINRLIKDGFRQSLFSTGYMFVSCWDKYNPDVYLNDKSVSNQEGPHEGEKEMSSILFS